MMRWRIIFFGALFSAGLGGCISPQLQKDYDDLKAKTALEASEAAARNQEYVKLKNENDALKTQTTLQGPALEAKKQELAQRQAALDAQNAEASKRLAVLEEQRKGLDARKAVEVAASWSRGIDLAGGIFQSAAPALALIPGAAQILGVVGMLFGIIGRGAKPAVA